MNGTRDRTAQPRRQQQADGSPYTVLIAVSLAVAGVVMAGAALEWHTWTGILTLLQVVPLWAADVRWESRRRREQEQQARIRLAALRQRGEDWDRRWEDWQRDHGLVN